jgi:transcriptional regulator with XRE-family HTH domain
MCIRNLIKILVDDLITLCKDWSMIIGSRLKRLREERNLSQGDIEKRTGLLRCYISRVENGHTVPSLETLERLAASLELPLYQLFYEGEEPPALPNLTKRQTTEELVLDAEQEKEFRFYEKVKRLLTRIDEKDRQLLLYMAQKLASR